MLGGRKRHYLSFAKSLLLLCSFVLASCGGNGREEFVSSCLTKGMTKDQCECQFDLAKEALEPEQFKMYKAILLDDQRTASEIQANTGFIDAGIMASRLLWVGSRAEEGCR